MMSFRGIFSLSKFAANSKNFCPYLGLFRTCPLLKPIACVRTVGSVPISTSIKRFTTQASQIKPKIEDHTSNIRVQHQRRLLRKKQKVDKKDQKNLEVVAFCTAREYQLPTLISAIQEDDLYDVFAISEEIDDAICIRSKYNVDSQPKEIFVFSCGTTVFWNVPILEQKKILEIIKDFEIQPHQTFLVDEEKEDLVYGYTSTRTRVEKGMIFLQNENEETIHEKYTVSNALSLSVQLSIWETLLEEYIESIKWITEDMIRGKRVKLTRKEVFRKTGELFSLRHSINLDSDLLDTPDFYWDRERLETLFHATRSLFSMTKRTNVMNEKLNHCCELMELLSHHLDDKHHSKLEWYIIFLILVEVAIGLWELSPKIISI